LCHPQRLYQADPTSTAVPKNIAPAIVVSNTVMGS
jgi:hypothetical protein